MESRALPRSLVLLSGKQRQSRTPWASTRATRRCGRTRPLCGLCRGTLDFPRALVRFPFGHGLRCRTWRSYPSSGIWSTGAQIGTGLYSFVSVIKPGVGLKEGSAQEPTNRFRPYEAKMVHRCDEYPATSFSADARSGGLLKASVGSAEECPCLYTLRFRRVGFRSLFCWLLFPRWRSQSWRRGTAGEASRPGRSPAPRRHPAKAGSERVVRTRTRGVKSPASRAPNRSTPAGRGLLSRRTQELGLVPRSIFWYISGAIMPAYFAGHCRFDTNYVHQGRCESAKMRDRNTTEKSCLHPVWAVFRERSCHRIVV